MKDAHRVKRHGIPSLLLLACSDYDTASLSLREHVANTQHPLRHSLRLRASDCQTRVDISLHSMWLGKKN